MSNRSHRHARSRPGPRTQRGVSLLFALLALVAMGLASAALVQSVGTGASVIGNLGLKQDATAAADQATRQAIDAAYTRLKANSTSLNNDNAAIGYYASSNDLIDVTGNQLPSSSTRNLVNWQNNCDGATGTCNLTPFTIEAGINGNTAQYVIFRLCSAAGDPAADSSIGCARPLTASKVASNYMGFQAYGSARTEETSLTPSYRIVVRVAGARNTISYTESIVHF